MSLMKNGSKCFESTAFNTNLILVRIGSIFRPEKEHITISLRRDRLIIIKSLNFIVNLLHRSGSIAKSNNAITEAKLRSIQQCMRVSVINSHIQPHKFLGKHLKSQRKYFTTMIHIRSSVCPAPIQKQFTCLFIAEKLTCSTNTLTAEIQAHATD